MVNLGKIQTNYARTNEEQPVKVDITGRSSRSLGPKTGHRAHVQIAQAAFRLTDARSDFREQLHLVQVFGAWTQDEFVHAHVGLTLDRVLHGQPRRR